MDTTATQGRAQSSSVLLRGVGLNRQRLHSPLGRTPIWPSQTRPHAISEVILSLSSFPECTSGV